MSFLPIEYAVQELFRDEPGQERLAHKMAAICYN
jgi:hypothetical protein